jgi:signal transduction histidine kinase/FixJ family two-component response regulator
VFAGGGEMGALVRAHDWAATPLGAIETWSASVKTAVSLCLTSRFPIVLWLGPELRLVYNDAYIPFLGEGKHPHVLGRPGREAWAEIWASIGPMHDEVRAAKATWVEDLQMFFARRLPLEEVYVTFAFSPILAGDGSTVEGTFCACTETSEKIIGERRLSTLRDLSVRLAEQRTVEAACRAAAEALQANAHDIPFAAVYLLDGEGVEAHRTAAVRLPTAADTFPATYPLRVTPPAARPWPLARVATTQVTEEIHDLAATAGVITAGPFPEPIETAFVLPLPAPSQPRLAGFLIVGLSPRRVLDAGYRSFLNLVAGHIATAIADARAFEAERRRAEALAELDRAKTAFFSNVSHEFRTPLTLMLGPLEEVLAGGPSSDLALIDTAHRNGLRLLKLVNTLLDFSRIEAGRAQAGYEPVDLATLTADLASSFRSAMERAGLDFTVATPGLPEPVHVDREMWEKVVLNLLSNAFKFTFEGGVAVTLAPSPDGSAAVLEVRDTGTGIPAEEVPRLFERFHRVAGARGRTFEGSGIGLALVQELVNLHGGTIRVESEEGGGSAFTVSLPFGTAHLPPDRINAERPAVSSAVRAQVYVEEALRWLPGGDGGLDDGISYLPTDQLGTAALPPATGGGPVLVADDNADMRDYVRRLLAGQGYEVEAVGDGEVALAAARRLAPDLVLSDVMMPRLDGFGLLKALQVEDGLRDVPVILLSARAGEEARVAGADAGADDYLTKPFSARELLARVGANLALARVRREALETLRGLNETLEARVAERTRERDSIWRLSRELMVVARPDGTTLAVNPACADTLGWTQDELLVV